MPLAREPLSIPAPSDAELIAATLAGDGTAYGALVERHQKRIFRVALAIVRNEMDADLVTQDTFVQAFVSLARFEARSCLETWLTRIAINKSRDALRARKASPLSLVRSEDEDGEPLDPPDQSPTPDRYAESKQISIAIERAVGRLSEQQRTIFCLRHYDDLSLEDIARMMELRSGTVRAHLFRAVHKVRRELAHWFPGSLERTR